MKVFPAYITVAFLAVSAVAFAPAVGKQDTDKTPKKVSFAKDIMPIIEDRCLRCHTEEKSNPSELYMDSYSSLMEGGKHGPPIIPGSAEKSIIVKKLGTSTPFGDRMPLKRRNAPVGNYLSDEQIQLISNWINQGAKDN
jgi:cytochrome c553